MKIYISGPITGTSDYLKNFNAAETILKAKGFDVFNPANMNDRLPPPPVTSYNTYMDTSLALLRNCDAICMIGTFEKSKGAILELAFAQAYGIKIYRLLSNIDNPDETSLQRIIDVRPVYNID